MDSAHWQPRAPGRLGDPSMYLATDPRTHPNLVEKLRADKIEGSPTFVAALPPDAPLGEVAAFTRTVEDYLEEYYTNMDLSPMPGEGSHGPIIRTEETIPPSHNDASLSSSSCTPRTMRLIIHRPDPATTPGPLHTIIYLHGGAMVMLSATNPLHTAWARSLAAAVQPGRLRRVHHVVRQQLAQRAAVRPRRRPRSQPPGLAVLGWGGGLAGTAAAHDYHQRAGPAAGPGECLLSEAGRR